MDRFGVPKKINRHVIKAIYQLADQESERSDLLNICDMVELSMKNNVPVGNLLSVVRQSLLNLYNLGVIKKQGNNYYTTSENVASLPQYHPKTVDSGIFEREIWAGEISTLNQNNKRKRLLSKGSITGPHPESSKKRLRRNKPLSRKGKRVNLPKIRKHADFQPSHSDGELEQDLWPCSSNENVMDSEDETENKTTISSTELKSQFSSQILKIPTMEEIQLENTNENSENLLQALDDSSHLVQNHQLNQLDDTLINDRIEKFEILNENKSQLDVDKNDDLQENCFVLIKKEDSMSSDTNMNDKSTE